MAKRKAHPSAGRGDAKAASGDPAAAAISAARDALARGDHRGARRLAREALTGAASETARDAARRVLADTSPDPAALIAAALVLLAIAFAAWAALLRHGPR